MLRRRHPHPGRPWPGHRRSRRRRHQSMGEAEQRTQPKKNDDRPAGDPEGSSVELGSLAMDATATPRGISLAVGELGARGRPNY